MLLPHSLVLFMAALIGGLLNSVAGGGGFIVFPALLFTGMPPINANATNTVALWPGTAASTFAYRRELAGVRSVLLPLCITGALGGLLGAIALLKTPQSTFLSLVPWLLLGATLLFAFSGRVIRLLRISEAVRASAMHSRRLLWLAILIQFVVSIYIGYFGAGAGILMLAMFALMGMESIHTMNGMKTVLASTVNAIAVITFVIAKAVMWPQAAWMILGAGIGGYGGAYYAQKIDPKHVRRFVIVIGTVLSAYFFIQNHYSK